MIYIRDTDTVSLWERGNAEVLRRILEHDQSMIMITVITLQEQITGRFLMISNAKTPQALASAYQQFADTFLQLRDLPVASFNVAALPRFCSLLKMKLNVGLNDLRIAATALARGSVVVTRTRRDF